MSDKCNLILFSIFLFSSLCLLCTVCEEVNHSTSNTNSEQINDEDNEFKPTHKWQIIKPGQAIPKGLHVRINLETGLKEAKILDNEKVNKKNALLEIEQPRNNENVNDKTYLTKELEQALKELKSDDNLKFNDKQEDETIRKKFKSYDQLKSELDELNLSIKSDTEILDELLQKHNEIVTNKSDVNSPTARNDAILTILQDFEYLVHQIDNAIEFAKRNGLNDIVYAHLNDSDVSIRCEALNIFGACVQNNARAQIAALETGAIDKLIKTLALDTEVSVKSRGIYAIGSLLRHFPLAQQHFVANGGLDLFTLICLNANANQDFKLRMKIVTLLYDLLTERNEAFANVDEANASVKRRQYEAVDFERRLIELNWCGVFERLLLIAEAEQDHDGVERCLNAFSFVAERCVGRDWIVLNRLYQRYEQLSSVEADVDDSYFIHLRQLIELVLYKIKPNSNHVEL